MSKKHEHGGNIWKLARELGVQPGDIVDFSANINPLGTPEWCRGEISRNISLLTHYPDPSYHELRTTLGYAVGVDPEQIVVGNGSTEIFRILPQVLQPERALILAPAYSDYELTSRQCGVDVSFFLTDDKDGFELDMSRLGSSIRPGDCVYIGRPNNPTGGMVDAELLVHLAQGNDAAYFVIDEAFIDFAPENANYLLGCRPENVIVVRSMTKFYALPGLRTGYAAAAPEIAAKLHLLLPRWSVNTLSQAIAARAAGDSAYATKSRQYVDRRRESLMENLQVMPGLRIYPSAANFLLCKIEKEALNAFELQKRLLKERIAIRVCDNFVGLDNRYFRVAVRTDEENTMLCGALEKVFCGKVKRFRKQKKTPALMLQGTSSNAGKSIITTALGRIMQQDGIKAAPFKAQNMALNSYVTNEGGEMGRAQVLQAQACGLEPEVRMNPVLLKPNSDTGAQVVLMGKPVGNKNVLQYENYKKSILQTVHEAYDSLAADYDVVVLEGAGSPAEVNLKDRDIVNMSMARHAASPVLLVGDIDRGGVYGAFVGTMEVLNEWERRLMKGFVVNKFRGDASLLAPAHDYVRHHTGVPVLGVVPHIRDLALPQEDSVDFEAGLYGNSGTGSGDVDFVVVKLPHTSNFTDIDPLIGEDDVNVRIIDSVDALKDTPDAVIIPGSKNVLGDLLFLRDSGIADIIKNFVQSGTTEIIGICGGFQMLGEAIHDPLGIESSTGRADGLGLLNVTTTLEREKTLKRVEGVHIPSNAPVKGYEIHHGVTDFNEARVIFRENDSGNVLGIESKDGLIWGTYLHGVFDSDQFRRRLINRLREKRGLLPIGKSSGYDIEKELDRLAGIVRDALDIEEIYRIMGL